MNILILNEEFTPDPHGYLLSDIASRLSVNGQNNIHFYATKSKHRIIDKTLKNNNLLQKRNFFLKRFWVLRSFHNSKIVKIFNSILFSLQCLVLGIFSKKFDLIICASSHIVFLGNAATILSKFHNSKLIYRVEDIHPHHLDFNTGSFIGRMMFNVFLNLEKYNYNNSTIILPISKNMKETIIDRTSKEIVVCEIHNIPRGITDIEENFTNKLLPKKNKMFRLVYTGNVGNFQPLDLIIESFFYLQNYEVELIIIGDGVRKKYYKKQSKNLVNKSIFFVDHVNIIEVNNFINSADLGIVSLKEGFERYAFPSKITGYLEMGCPILSISAKDSSLSNLIRQSDVGIIHYNKNPKELSQKILKCKNNKNFKLNYRENISHLMKTSLSKEMLLDKWIEIINRI